MLSTLTFERLTFVALKRYEKDRQFNVATQRCKTYIGCFDNCLQFSSLLIAGSLVRWTQQHNGCVRFVSVEITIPTQTMVVSITLVWKGRSKTASASLVSNPFTLSLKLHSQQPQEIQNTRLATFLNFLFILVSTVERGYRIQILAETLVFGCEEWGIRAFKANRILVIDILSNFLLIFIRWKG